MRGPVDVEIYWRPLCGYCTLARRLLSTKGVTAREYNVWFDRARAREVSERAKGHRTVPQIFVGGRHVGGYAELAALEESGELDGLLWPDRGVDD